MKIRKKKSDIPNPAYTILNAFRLQFNVFITNNGIKALAVNIAYTKIKVVTRIRMVSLLDRRFFKTTFIGIIFCDLSLE